MSVLSETDQSKLEAQARMQSEKIEQLISFEKARSAGVHTMRGLTKQLNDDLARDEARERVGGGSKLVGSKSIALSIMKIAKEKP